MYVCIIYDVSPSQAAHLCMLVKTGMCVYVCVYVCVCMYYLWCVPLTGCTPMHAGQNRLHEDRPQRPIRLITGTPLHLYTPIHLYTYTPIHTYTHLYTYTPIHLYTPILTYTHLYTYTPIHTYTHLYTLIHLYTYTHLYTPLIHLNTHIRLLPAPRPTRAATCITIIDTIITIIYTNDAYLSDTYTPHHSPPPCTSCSLWRWLCAPRQIPWPLRYSIYTYTIYTYTIYHAPYDIWHIKPTSICCVFVF
jgi:hypothetical protein